MSSLLKLATYIHALLYSPYIDDDGNLDIPAALSLLRPYTKYDFASRRKRLVRNLTKVFPNTLEEYSKPECVAYRAGLTTLMNPLHALKIVKVAEANVLLPALLYLCSSLSIKTVFSKARDILPLEDLEWLLNGRETIASHLQPIPGELAYAEFKRCPERDGCDLQDFLNRAAYLWTAIATAVYTERVNYHGFSDQQKDLFTTSLFSRPMEMVPDCGWKLCTSCRETVENKLDELRREKWDILPEMFDVAPDWDVLRQTLL